MDRVTKSDLQQALAVLRQGGLVAVPTETVYGLAADATNEKAVANIYKAKGRPNFNPLIAHISGLEMGERYGVFNTLSRQLAQAFWPGPLTLVVPLVVPAQAPPAHKAPLAPLAKAVTAGLDHVALRHPLGAMAQLAQALNTPLAAPSANSSGRISPTRAAHVKEDLGNKVDYILNGGACRVGVESTIIKCDEQGATLLREGGLAAEAIEALIGPLRRGIKKPKVEAPGMLLAHYAPRAPIRLNATSVTTDEALLAFGNTRAKGTPKVMMNLSPEGNMQEAAHHLFAMMKALDSHQPTCIAVEPIPTHDLGAAINDRLKRAAYKENASLMPLDSSTQPLSNGYENG